MNYSIILKRITPTREDIDTISSTTKEIVNLITDAAIKQDVPIEVVPGGSTAKGTFLKGNFDVDIFVRFKGDNSDLSNTLELLLASFAPEQDIVIERVHGSRDYFTFTYNNLFFEIVPVKYVTKPQRADNVTDMSPLHVFWVKEKLNKKLRDDIRLAKQFCKAQGVYGAESFINGLSGHVLDILIIYYGGFDAFINAATKWGKVTVIDPEQKHDDVFEELNESKLVSPLVVIDPIDAHRNAAAALSQEKYVAFINSAKEFVNNPSKDFFIIPDFDLEKVKEKKSINQDLFVVSVSPLLGKRDVVATKVLKVFEFLARHLKLHDFVLDEVGWHYDPHVCHLYFFAKKQELDSDHVHQGPPLDNAIGVKKFKEAHKDYYEKNGRLYVKLPRDFRTIQDCLHYLLEQDFVTQRVAHTSFEVFTS